MSDSDSFYMLVLRLQLIVLTSLVVLTALTELTVLAMLMAVCIHHLSAQDFQVSEY